MVREDIDTEINANVARIQEEINELKAYMVALDKISRIKEMNGKNGDEIIH